MNDVESGPQPSAAVASRYLDRVQAFLDAAANVRSSMAPFEHRLEIARRRLHDGADPIDAIVDVESDGLTELRRSLHAALTELATASKLLRGVSARLLVDHGGLTITETARVFEVSVQMARRLYRAADVDHG